MTLPTDLLALPAGLSHEVVTTLAARSVRRDSVASFQALLAALTEAVDATREPVAQAEAAALSLRQRETVEAVRADLQALLAALASGVSSEARCLARPWSPRDLVRAVLRPTPGWRARRAAQPTTWVAAAGAAVEALGETAAHASMLAAAQPAPSSARVLGDRVADALLAGRDALLADVARVVD